MSNRPPIFELADRHHQKNNEYSKIYRMFLELLQDPDIGSETPYQQLLDLGIPDINTKIADQTLFHSAILFGKFHIANLLLDYGADAEIPFAQSHPLKLLIKTTHLSYLKSLNLKEPELIGYKQLISKLLDSNMSDDEFNTWRKLAIQEKNTTVSDLFEIATSKREQKIINNVIKSNTTNAIKNKI